MYRAQVLIGTGEEKFCGSGFFPKNDGVLCAQLGGRDVLQERFTGGNRGDGGGKHSVNLVNPVQLVGGDRTYGREE